MAAANGLDPDARTGHPTGGENSRRINREVVLISDHSEVYTRLAEVIAWDWSLSR
ncbi:MAG: hypothetical protein H3C34_11950 [Caldilineaceae bacterium]|nr:hypothetical protein [Caldilineaceae bacterium]